MEDKFYTLRTLVLAMLAGSVILPLILVFVFITNEYEINLPIIAVILIVLLTMPLYIMMFMSYPVVGDSTLYTKNPIYDLRHRELRYQDIESVEVHSPTAGTKDVLSLKVKLRGEDSVRTVYIGSMSASSIPAFKADLRAKGVEVKA